MFFADNLLCVIFYAISCSSLAHFFSHSLALFLNVHTCVCSGNYLPHNSDHHICFFYSAHIRKQTAFTEPFEPTSEWNLSMCLYGGYGQNSRIIHWFKSTYTKLESSTDISSRWREKRNALHTKIRVCAHEYMKNFSSISCGFFARCLLFHVQLLLFGCFPNIFLQYFFLLPLSVFFCFPLIFSYFSCCWFATTDAIIWCWYVRFSLLWDSVFFSFISILAEAARRREKNDQRRKLAHMRRMTMKLIFHNFFVYKTRTNKNGSGTGMSMKPC